MADETNEQAVPVKGWLDRIDKNGKPEHVDFDTPEAIAQAQNHYSDDDLANLIVEYSDGTKARPYRFCPTVASVETVETEDEGNWISI